MSWEADQPSIWSSHGCLIAIPLAALALIVLRPGWWSRLFKAESQRKAKSVGGVAAGRGGRFFKLVPSDRRTPVLRAGKDRLGWFAEFAQRICEVRHGIFYGEAGGERLPSWSPETFATALTQLRGKVGENAWPDGGKVHEPLDDVALAARLIAADMNVEEAAKLVDEYADYRRMTCGGVVPTQEWLEYGIVVVPCEDLLGRPVVNIRPRYHRPGNIELFRHGLRTTLDAIKAHFMHKRQEGFSESNPLEQYTMVWDFAGAGWRNLDWEAFHVTIHEGAHHYPNMGSQIYVLNVSAPLRWVWNAASRFLHPRVRRKCLLVAPSEVAACMEKVMPKEQLPPEYGGFGAPWPGPEAASTLEDQVGAIAAAAYERAGVVPAGALPRRNSSTASNPVPPPPPRRVTSARRLAHAVRLRGCMGCFG